MNAIQLKAQIKSGELAPVYLWYGEEQYLIEEALGLLKDSKFGLADRVQKLLATARPTAIANDVPIRSGE